MIGYNLFATMIKLKFNYDLMMETSNQWSISENDRIKNVFQVLSDV